jgi:preprotein translocase subunit SecG
MLKFIQIVQFILSILLIIFILLQHRGTGLGGAFGGESSIYRSKRGIEKFLYLATIIIAVLFVLLSIANLFVMIA